MARSQYSQATKRIAAPQINCYKSVLKNIPNKRFLVSGPSISFSTNNDSGLAETVIEPETEGIRTEDTEIQGMLQRLGYDFNVDEIKGI